MLLAEPGWPDLRLAGAATLGIWLVASAAAAFNCLVEQHIDAKMARTAWRPTRQGRTHQRADAGLLGRAVRRRQRGAVPVGQPADDVADLRHLRRLCGDLHRGAQAADAAEHRHRRRLGRDAAGAGLGGDAQRRRPRGADAVPDHLPVDAAAFLGAGAVPRRGLPQVGPADAADHPWRRVHAAAGAAVHAGAVRRHAAALHLRHERLALPGQRAGAGRDVHRLRLAAVARLQRCAGAAHLPLLDPVPEPAVQRIADRPLPAAHG